MQHRQLVPALLLGASLIFGALGTQPAAAADSGAQPEIPKAWPKWLKKAMKKESRKKKTQDLSLGDGAIVAEIVGKLSGEIETLESGWFFNADFGSDMPISCWIYTQPRNGATQLEGLHQVLIEQTVEANEAQLDAQVPYYVNSGLIGQAPFLASEWLYTIKVGSSTQSGFSKARVAHKDGATFACTHLEMGYRKTFARIFETLVETAQVKTGRTEPYYTEVVKLTLGDQPAGFGSVEFALDAEGDTRIDVVTSLLLRIDASTVVASDSTKIEFSTPSGAVINAYDTTVENGEIGNDLALNYTDEDGWFVQGTFGGKEIAVAVESDEAPLSTLGQMLAARSAIGNDEGRSLFKAWVSEADPSKFLDASVVVNERGKNRHAAKVALGPIVLDANLDDQGSTIDAVMNMGAVTLNMERVVVTGSVRDPNAD